MKKNLEKIALVLGLLVGFYFLTRPKQSYVDSKDIYNLA